MVISLSAGAHAAEWDIWVDDLQEHVVHDSAARSGRGEDPFDYRAIFGKNMQWEGFLSGQDDRDRFVQIPKCQHGQDRAEDLLTHHGHFRCDAGEERRRDVSFARVTRATEGDPGAGSDAPLEQLRYAVKRAVVDHTWIIGVVDPIVGARPVKALDSFLRSLDKAIHHALMYQRVIGGNAGLAGVLAFSPHPSPGRCIDIGRLVDDRGGFSAQLERDSREASRGSSHDFFSNPRASSEEDVIERHIETSVGNSMISSDNCYLVLSESGTDQFVDYAGCVRGFV